MSVWLVCKHVCERGRTVLGGRSAIEVMTGQRPDSAVRLTTWSGVLMKEAQRGDALTAVIEGHCTALIESLGRLHEAVRDQDEANRRRAALRAEKKGPGLRFNRGDFVMLPSHGNAANVQKHSKVMMGWQGPYEVVGSVNGSPAEFVVRLLGDTREKPVHWKKNTPDCRPRAAHER